MHQSPWCCPESGWQKINCDGAVDPRAGVAAIGGVIRDSDERDILEAIEIIHCSESNLTNGLLVHDIKEFLSREWRVQIRHINRCGNTVADILARMFRGKPVGEVCYANPLKGMSALAKDMSSCQA
ncbi:hypothetical protein V6N11_040103 [Hibiscus sabdariffa]|uniref:RNase H type-1 domain-containing protein n=1 Tax=Hibiscus sabdariffa TaxID=183260 RepID=A0ABR2RGG8_9ROSI